AFRLRRSFILRASQRAALIAARTMPGRVRRDERIFRAGIVKFGLCNVAVLNGTASENEDGHYS
ncbi:hypothetical protein AB9F39_36890, partial [Rhizobium leguminosarum]